MASIDKVASGWRARWRTPDGASRSKTFKRKVDAERHLTAVEHSKLTATYVDPRAGKVSFRKYAEEWRAAQIHRPGTATQVETNLRRHVYPRIGDRPIGAIRQSEIQALVKAMLIGGKAGGEERDPLAPATIAVAYSWVATIFKAAVYDRVIAVSPCRAIRLPQVDEHEMIPIGEDVVEALAVGMPGPYRAMIVLGAGTGLRISEALGLTKDRVDWLRRTVTVDRQLVGVRENRPVLGPVKDKRNRPRTIPVPESVVKALAGHVERYGLGPDDLLFTGPRGGPLRRTTFSDNWVAVAGPLGIPLGDGFHQLRHFYASVLIRAGESVKVVQKRLGHTSAQMTLDVYGHLWPDDDDQTRDAVDAVLGPARVSRMCHVEAVGE
jgi:integrase